MSIEKGGNVKVKKGKIIIFLTDFISGIDRFATTKACIILLIVSGAEHYFLLLTILCQSCFTYKFDTCCRWRLLH